MNTTKTTALLSTDAKVFINNWQAIRKIITEHTTLVKKSQNETEQRTSSSVFSDQQITDALTGPYQQFIKRTLSAYAKLTFLRLQLTIHQDDSLKSPHHRDTEVIPSKILEKQTLSDLDKIQSQLDVLTQEHHQQWQEKIKTWNKQLTATLTKLEIPLNDIEVKELQDKEPLSELLDRFTELNIELPKLGKSDFNYEKYLRLKTELAIRSSLSRRHQSNTKDDVQAIIKKMKNDFTQIEQQEKTLWTEQNNATLKIIDPILALIPK